MLTERVIRDAKPGPRAAIIWDSNVKGFGVKIQPGGTKSFVLSYRKDGRKKLANIGRVGELSLKAARERAAAELLRIRDGGGGLLERRRETREAPTVADAVARFLDQDCPRRIANGRMGERTLSDYRSQCTSTILPALGQIKIADVSRADVERMVDPLRPVQRNRVLALASRIFTLAEHWGWREQRTNPARGIERSVEQARDRVLSTAELAALAGALDTVEANPMAVAAIRLAALTGLRIGEVLAMEWSHVDFEAGRLTMPKTKTGRRTHDLADPALAVLASVPRINRNPHVFASGASAAVTYKTVRRHFALATRAAGLSDIRLHDLRRTVMTSAARSGVGSHVLRDMLGHKTTVMADRYVRSVGEAVRDARQHVAAEMANAMAGKPGNVVPMRREHG